MSDFLSLITGILILVITLLSRSGTNAAQGVKTLWLLIVSLLFLASVVSLAGLLCLGHMANWTIDGAGM